MQAKGERKLAMLTAYDYPTALLVDEVGMDMILVGDSLAMVVLGHDDTLAVTLDEMIHHCRAVARAAKTALVVGDMPFLSYEATPEQAVRSAGRMMKEGGARAVKIEGGREMAPQIRAMSAAGIPVMGHIGLTPQRVARIGGFLVQGKTADAAQELIDEGRELAEAGCFSMVLEAIPAPVAKLVTEAVPIPTIGIGAGPDCDGQVLVLHDILGLFERFTPKFVKRYASLADDIRAAVSAYRQEVADGVFPAEEHSFSMQSDELKKLF
jgi:3-methyl-2-oxobutanoate hydroxymethyltransferase